MLPKNHRGDILIEPAVGTRHSRHIRLLPSSREAVADAESGSHVHRRHLDALVSDYQAEELLVRFTSPHSPLCFPFPFLGRFLGRFRCGGGTWQLAPSSRFPTNSRQRRTSPLTQLPRQARRRQFLPRVRGHSTG